MVAVCHQLLVFAIPLLSKKISISVRNVKLLLLILIHSLKSRLLNKDHMLSSLLSMKKERNQLANLEANQTSATWWKKLKRCSKECAKTNKKLRNLVICSKRWLRNFRKILTYQWKWWKKLWAILWCKRWWAILWCLVKWWKTWLNNSVLKITKTSWKTCSANGNKTVRKLKKKKLLRKSQKLKRKLLRLQKNQLLNKNNLRKNKSTKLLLLILNLLWISLLLMKRWRTLSTNGLYLKTAMTFKNLSIFS